MFNQLILFAHLCLSVAGYLYSGHEFMPELYDGAHRSPSNYLPASAPSAPQFLAQPPAQVTFLNETGLVLPCSVYAQPKATIKWLQPNAFDANSYLYNGKCSFFLRPVSGIPTSSLDPEQEKFISDNNFNKTLTPL